MDWIAVVEDGEGRNPSVLPSTVVYPFPSGYHDFLVHDNGFHSSRWPVIEGSFDGLWKIPKMCFIENMTIARSIWLTKN